MNEEHPNKDSNDTLEEDRVTLDSQENDTTEQDEAVSVKDLQKEIEILQDQLLQANEKVMRAAADVQNARRRAEQDIEKAHKFGLEKFVSDMLPVADNLERAIQSASADGATTDNLLEGVELTLKTLLDGLKRHKVDQVDPEGEPFNPQHHQAMTMVENPHVEPNTVLNVFQKGYTLNERLVRPAMVVVSKAAQASAESE